jgi:hypothetical protein
VSAGIPAYAASGRRLRNYSHEAVDRLLALERPGCVAKRNKRTGRVTSITFLPLPQNSTAVEGKEPIRKTAHMGQSYSFKEHLTDTGLRTWMFTKLLLPRAGDEEHCEFADEMERRLQMIFRAVPLSCMVVEMPRRDGSPAAELLPEPSAAEPLPEPPEPPTPSNVIMFRPRAKQPATVAYDPDAVRRAA